MTKHRQTLVTKHFTVWTPCLVLFDRIWSCLIKYEGHQTFDQKLKTFLLYSCLMGDVLFVWTAAYQTCLKRACVPHLFSNFYQLFHLCLIAAKYPSHRYIAFKLVPVTLNSGFEGDICLRAFGSDFNFKPAAPGSFCRLKGSWCSSRALYYANSVATNDVYGKRQK